MADKDQGIYHDATSETDNNEGIYHDATSEIAVHETSAGHLASESRLGDSSQVYYELEPEYESAGCTDGNQVQVEGRATTEAVNYSIPDMKKFKAILNSNFAGDKKKTEKIKKKHPDVITLLPSSPNGQQRENLGGQSEHDKLDTDFLEYETAHEISQHWYGQSEHETSPSKVTSENSPIYDTVHVSSRPKTRHSADNSVYQRAAPIFGKSDTVKSTSSSIGSSANKGWVGGVGLAKIHKVDETSTEYERLYFKSIDSHLKLQENMREVLKNRGYGSLASINAEFADETFQDSNIYGQAAGSVSDAEEEGESFWGSEFDENSVQEELPEVGDYSRAPEKPLPPVPGKRVKPFLHKAKSVPYDPHGHEDPFSTSCLPVVINPQKHPPPLLPPQPGGLTHTQIKRRLIIDSIINSERSYLESLERVIKDYEKPVSEMISLSKVSIRRVFSSLKEIISHHKMFQIELSERVFRWDREERIGDIFTASFSKSMLINAYSAYVNNFAAAMEEIRTLQRNKSSFQDFMLKQEKLSNDRLSIFGLMVKPVQRFPQFIMFLQDLIKYTPQDHSDRRALQLALTELENVAYRLNERKRQSEQKFQASQTIQQLIRQKVHHVLTPWNVDVDPERRLIRTDDLEHVQGDFENLKCKSRRLILMNDLVLCCKVVQKEQSGLNVERLVLRWVAKLKDLELKDTAITPDMVSIIKKEPGRVHILSSRPEKPEEDPFHLFADLHDMVHDHMVMGQISGLLSTLKRTYARQGLSEELILEISRDLQHMIQVKEEQLRLVNSCSIVLQDMSRSDKVHYVLQTKTAAIKQDWCVDFLMSKLAQDRSNNLSWDGSMANEDMEFDGVPAFFMKYLPVDVPKNFTKIRCAVSIFLNPEKSNRGIGVQHLWVCSSTPSHGQVSVLSVHNSKPALMESFSACNSEILAVELVPGCGDTLTAGNFLFPEDTVWLTTAHREVLIFPLSSTDGVHRQPHAVVRTPAITVSLKFVDERLFCGFDDGAMNVYSRRRDGSWNVSEPVLLNFGTSRVKLHFIHEENIWLSCGPKLYQLEIDSLKTQASFVLSPLDSSPIDQVVRAGIGIWVSFLGSSVIKVFHLETLENLQEISVGSFVLRLINERPWKIPVEVDSLVVTCMTVSRGLLWVGTNLGLVLTVPLPRLSDGVPLYRGRPKVSLHAHRGPVRFLVPMNSSTNILELNRASSLRSTLHARQSRRNQEREKLELEESEKRKGMMQEEVETKTLHAATATSKEQSKNNSNGQISETSKTNVSALTGNGTDVQTETCTNESEDKARDKKKSKAASFRTELAQRIIDQTQTLASSELDPVELEVLEVEQLYEILLEDEESSSEVEQNGIEISHQELFTKRRSHRWSVAEMPSSSLLNLDSQVVKPSRLNVASSQANQNSSHNVVSGLDLSVPCKPVSVGSSSMPPEAEGFIVQGAGIMRGSSSRLTLLRKVKASSNAVIVLSGGDGYCDLDQSRNQATLDDACVFLWLHK